MYVFQIQHHGKTPCTHQSFRTEHRAWAGRPRSHTALLERRQRREMSGPHIFRKRGLVTGALCGRWRQGAEAAGIDEEQRGEAVQADGRAWARRRQRGKRHGSSEAIVIVGVVYSFVMSPGSSFARGSQIILDQLTSSAIFLWNNVCVSPPPPPPKYNPSSSFWFNAGVSRTF